MHQRTLPIDRIEDRSLKLNVGHRDPTIMGVITHHLKKLAKQGLRTIGHDVWLIGNS